jgi:hypothetical protein
VLHCRVSCPHRPVLLIARQQHELSCVLVLPGSPAVYLSCFRDLLLETYSYCTAKVSEDFTRLVSTSREQQKVLFDVPLLCTSISDCHRGVTVRYSPDAHGVLVLVRVRELGEGHMQYATTAKAKARSHVPIQDQIQCALSASLGGPGPANATGPLPRNSRGCGRSRMHQKATWACNAQVLSGL